jgi:hypothetical protein
MVVTVSVAHPVFQWARTLPGVVCVFGGYIRDSIAGEPFADIDLHATNVKAVVAELDAQRVPWVAVGTPGYDCIRCVIDSVQVDIMDNFLQTPDFWVNGLAADIRTGEVSVPDPHGPFALDTIVQNIHDRIIYDEPYLFTRAHRFSHMVRKGYRFVCEPRPSPSPSLGTPDPPGSPSPFCMYDCVFTRFPALRAYMREHDAYATGPDAYTLSGSGGIHRGTRTYVFHVIKKDKGNHESCLLDDVNEFGDKVEIIMWDCPRYWPISIAYAQILHDGNIADGTPACVLDDLEHKRLVFVCGACDTMIFTYHLYEPCLTIDDLDSFLSYGFEVADRDPYPCDFADTLNTAYSLVNGTAIKLI